MRSHIRPRKDLGQHFIVDTDITDRVAQLLGDLSGLNVIEIGPGLGILTQSLLRTNLNMLYAIETDARCVQALQPLKDRYPDRLVLIHGDALSIDESKLITGPTAIVANLPYNIGTLLVLKWMQSISLFKRITIMLQKEVVERITARPNTQSYGRLSVICQWLCQVECGFDIEPGSFDPPPKVMSSIVTLRPMVQPLFPCNQCNLEDMTNILFSQKRKMVSSILRKRFKDRNVEDVLKELNISPTKRPEALTVQEICSVATALS
ncbi:16S rRNA (adenine(1518)-N(6)/adenine(1519)-N(6))-dimethyltransferase RsmA [Rickettsiales endosymbiont of Peranema trichophorum]|uniref:16S rRNA (adenine(1518)-N(6)/adenine(1519)-N(6))- dimethyltransferase RsmA n=1 Tax=Rickettsiales endosymbiont of Peranema trichophorum TaxID=2486577 RepID=UPI0010234D3B|nr:16S rRNA (adenine(1518)-N(6)/adenine(1519)-N(6))-dimethyltransferase RsmA [Rickettsiales endosymbiont of Peranema trichophorum]RZI46707.1 16S rRNA (adenine(1518)-N(6)/adenine(1519)-N(6))-dimethyltransferase RsmA [Rickettsiales endosymbiont of Peranema trichophorum]